MLERSLAILRIPIAVASRCPECKSTDNRRSARQNLGERILGLIVLPHRCNACYARFFKLRFAKASPPASDKVMKRTA